MRDKETRLKLLRWFIHSPTTYRVLRPVLDLQNMKENPAYKLWVRFLLDIHRQAYAHKQPVIWMNSFVPTEIVYGVGAIPFFPELMASLVSYMGWSEHPIARADVRISTDLCSFYRCALGLALEGFLPRPDLIVSSSHLCDGSNKLFHYFSQIYGCPHFMLDPPYHQSSSSHQYMKDQLKDLVEKTCGLLRLPMDQERFSHVLNLSNHTRQYLIKINELRRSTPSPFPGSEGLSYFAGMNFYSLGSGWAIRFFQSLLDHIGKKVVNRKGYLLEEKHRLLWLHHVRPYYKNEIFQILAERKAAVSFEESNYLYWPPLDPSQPWESLSNKILSNVWAGPLEKRMKAIEEMVENYSIDGVIHFSHWGCRQSCGGAAVIGDWLKKRGIPYLVLPGDCADSNNYSPGQTRTRLEAFIEMLE
jgi:benzoyl-CoA reductase/2-hydroxyglutaryl-CoA dehydratase subunit BcrC/BadD/HgdB